MNSTPLTRPKVVLHNGDCLEIMRAMPDASFDLSIFSPPYNLSNSTGTGLRSPGSSKWKNCKLGQGYGSYTDDLPYAEYVKWQKAVLREVWRLTAHDGAIFYQHKTRIQAGRLQTPLELLPEELRDNLRQIVIWNRAGGFNFIRSFYLPTHEWIVILAKPAWRLKSKSGVKDVWAIKPARNNDHPAPFPVELPQQAISTTAAKTIFDPFMGSGSTAIAALREGRNFVGIELDAGYFAKTVSRIEAEAKGTVDIIAHSLDLFKVAA